MTPRTETRPLHGAVSGLAVAALVALWSAVPAHAEDALPGKTLKVCQDPNNLPFSNDAGQGIENRIAEVFGKAMDVPVQYYSFPQRLAFVRNTLKYKLPGEDYRCDVMLGVPAGFGQVSTTKPYYTSTYAIVYPKGHGLDGVQTTQDLLALGPEKLSKLRIGIFDRSPASQWLARHNLVDQGVPYKMMDADPAYYPGQIIDHDLAQGKIDLAIVWGPIAGYYAKQVKSPEMVVVPMASEPGIKLDYAMAMGVRYGEPEWKAKVEGVLDSHRDEIKAILTEYGVPLVDTQDAVVSKRAD